MVSKSGQRVFSSSFRYLILSVFVLSAANLGCGKKSTRALPEAVIHGGSMAPSFLGEHFRIECVDCLYTFSVDANDIPASAHAICPNCGASENAYPSAKPNSSTAIKLDLANHTFDRWDVLAFRFSDSNLNGIKRLVGLPGEQVEIRNGDVWVDGTLAKRSFKMKKEMRVLCYDSQFTPSAGPERLLDANGRAPIKREGPFEDFGKNDEGTWLAFQPVNCFLGATNRRPVPFILDSYGFNQAVTRGRLNKTQQLMVEADIQIRDEDVFAVFVRFEDDLIGFRIDWHRGEVSITQGQHVLERANFALPETETTLLASTVDGEFQLFVDGKLICQASQSERAKHVDRILLPDGMSRDLPVYFHAVGRSDRFSFQGLRIYRDVYYTDRARVDFLLSDDEYLVLGDNSPVSVDSRVWSSPFLTSEQIIGKVQRIQEK